ncbi:MAG TPA: ABC transporter ATP-binding protein [Methanospirillum sp.]|nr:ABC transporter ATP-binding protein [Methanospirillum sp.]
MKLDVVDLSFAYDTFQVLQEVNITAEEKITAVLGPNGAGKSTLLTCIAGIHKPKGDVYLDNTNISEIQSHELSKSVSYLPQDGPSRAVLTVLEAVLLGRLHSLKWKVPREDLDMAYTTLSDLGIDNLAGRKLNELSGGQRQMVSIAQAIARDPKILLMDEPTNSLDLQHQLEMFDLVQEISHERKITALVALHDLNLAARYADNLVVLDGGKICASGKPEQVLTSEMIESVYGVHADIATDTEGFVHVTPVCSVKGRERKRSRMVNS